MRWFWVWLRKWYESRINLNHGYLCFLANFASLQIKPEEYLDIAPPSKRSGTIRITSNDMRPMLTFKHWPQGEEWSKLLPFVSVILEEKRILVRNEPRLADGQSGEWEPVTVDDSRVSPLKPLFHSFSFYQPMRKQHKAKLAEAPPLRYQCDLCLRSDGRNETKRKLLLCNDCFAKNENPKEPPGIEFHRGPDV